MNKFRVGMVLILAALFSLSSVSVVGLCDSPGKFMIYYDGFAGDVKTFYVRGDNGKFLTKPAITSGRAVTVAFEPDASGTFTGFMKINSSLDWRSSGINLSVYRDERDCSLHISDAGGAVLRSAMHEGRNVCLSQRGDTVRLARCSS